MHKLFASSFRFGAVLTVLALALFTFGAFAQAQTVTIGMLGPLSGDYATYGTSVANGAELAINEANASGRYNVTFRFQKEDTQGDPASAANAITKLIERDMVTGIIGAVLSGETLTAGLIAQDEGVPFITPSGTAPDISLIGDFEFRNVITDDVQSAQMVDYVVNELGFKRLAVIYSNNDYGLALRQGFEAGVKAAGADLVAVESYLDGDSDFSAQMTNIIAQNPDGVFIAGYSTEGSKIAQQAVRLGFTGRFMGADGFDSPELVELGGSAVEGTLYTSGFDPSTDDGAARTFIDNYKAAYGMEPDMFAANAYDSARIMIEVIGQVGNNRTALRDGIAATRDFPGVTGLTSFAENGDAQKPLLIFEIQDGKPVRVR